MSRYHDFVSIGVARNEIELGALLHARRRSLGLTQAQVAAQAGVSRAFVVDLERGKRTGAELGRVLAVTKALNAGLALTEVAPDTFDSVLDRLLGGGSG